MRYARIHTVNHPTGRPSLDGMADGYLFAEVARSRSTLVSLWPSRAEAEAATAAAPEGIGTVVRDEIYEVRYDLAGPDAAADATAGCLLDFEGPQSPARLAAAEAAFEQRIKPIFERLPGCVRVLVLVHPETRAQVVVHLNDSFERLAEVERAVTTSPLLPGEDAALLPGPDRATVLTVTEVRTSEGAVR
jgi:hypothetical protein